MFLVRDQAGRALSQHADVVSANRASRKRLDSQVIRLRDGALLSTALEAHKINPGRPRFGGVWGRR
jgi:hypothetical protein